MKKKVTQEKVDQLELKQNIFDMHHYFESKNLSSVDAIEIFIQLLAHIDYDNMLLSNDERPELLLKLQKKAGKMIVYATEEFLTRSLSNDKRKTGDD